MPRHLGATSEAESALADEPDTAFAREGCAEETFAIKGPARRWRILLTDAYTGHLGDELNEIAWAQGVVNHIKIGGGTTGIVQVPDTHLHAPLSREYQDLEMTAYTADAELEPHRVPKRDREDWLRDIVAVWRQPRIHENAAEGFWQNMLKNALDGTEDARGAGAAKKLWDTLGMDKLRSEARLSSAIQYTVQ